MENTLSTSWTCQRLLELFQQNKKLLVATHPADMDQDVTIWIKLESASFITNSLTMLIKGSNQRNPAEMANGARDCAFVHKKSYTPLRSNLCDIECDGKHELDTHMKRQHSSKDLVNQVGIPPPNQQLQQDH